LVALCPQNITIESKASAQLPVPDVKSNTSKLAVSANNNAVITIHTTNSIQGNSLNAINQQVSGIRKAILSNIDNAIFIAKGSAKNAIPVNVNAKMIANGRADTTQGIDMTKTYCNRTNECDKCNISKYCISFCIPTSKSCC